jgi:hypothetical protein
VNNAVGVVVLYSKFGEKHKGCPLSSKLITGIAKGFSPDFRRKVAYKGFIEQSTK